MYDSVLQRKAFENCVQKLRANYGREKFTNEKCDLIWEELRCFSPKQIENICHLVLGESQFAPTIGLFREKASLLRERIHAWEKTQKRKEAEQFWEGTYHSSEVRSIVETIKLRALNKISDSDYRQFQELLITSSRPDTQIINNPPHWTERKVD